jgi:hypothetical protein
MANECSRSYEAGYADGYNRGALIALREVEEGNMDSADDWRNVASPRIHTSSAARKQDADISRRMATKAKTKRKVSPYQKKYGSIFKKLKAKHPRMKFGALSKKAHSQTKREMKK